MTVQADFSITETADRGFPVLNLEGEADVVTAPQIRDSLFAMVERSSIVVIDMSRLSFIDSTALGVMVVAAKRFGTEGGELHLVGLQPHVRKVFDITGLSEAFSIHGHLGEVQRALAV